MLNSEPIGKRKSPGERVVGLAHRRAGNHPILAHFSGGWALLTRDHAAGGHPIAVMGPQVGYFAPQILLELDLHGGGIDARGAAWPTFQQVVQVGN